SSTSTSSGRPGSATGAAPAPAARRSSISFGSVRQSSVVGRAVVPLDDAVSMIRAGGSVSDTIRILNRMMEENQHVAAAQELVPIIADKQKQIQNEKKELRNALQQN